MAQINSREIALLAPTTITTNGSGVDVPLAMSYGAYIISVALTTVSGTSPTFNFFCQSKLQQAQSGDTSGLDVAASSGAIYDDFLAFTQMTTNGTRVARMVISPLQAGTPSTSGSLAVGVDYAKSDAALTANNARLGPIGNNIRVKWTVGGTSPSCSAVVTAQFLPISQ